jgi:DNA replication protein DnaC
MSGRKRSPGPSDLTDRLRQHLDVIGLTYTLEHLDEHLAWATQEKPAAGALLDHVLGAEAAYKLERRIQRRIDQSGLPERKTLEAFDFPFQPKLDKALVMEIAGLDFARRKEDLVVTGKTDPMTLCTSLLSLRLR